jgi:flavin-dependent dehydrogenase
MPNPPRMGGESSAENTSDVTVIGGGLTGLAASVQLAKSGLSVICLEPVTEFGHIVGESLDWSAPDLFNALELRMEDLVGAEVSTYKRHVILTLPDGSSAEYIPPPWLGRAPFNIELRTLHIDRLRLHRELIRLAKTHGVTLVQDRAVAVERNGAVIVAIQTALRQRLVSSWFIDASGAAASFLGREFKLPAVEYGPRKVALWTYLAVSDWQEGTTLYTEALPNRYMDWVWEIPINPGTISVGYVTTGAAIKEQRARGFSVEEILKRQIMKFARFRALPNDIAYETPRTTSFTCRVYKGVCGPNWIIAGEAASMPDPITGNGVTAALRHAAEASRLISKFAVRGRFSPWARATYNLRVFQMGKFFNSLIEKLAYDWPVRDRLGMLTAGDYYTVPAWSTNVLYSRIRPDGMLSTALFSLFLSSLRAAAWCFYRACRWFARTTPVLANSES